jgi:hypothetical protein
MPLLLLAGSMFGVLEIAAAAQKRIAQQKKDLPNNTEKPSFDARSIGSRLAAAL